MQIFYWPYSLQFKHPFAISSVTRTDTKVVYIEIKENEISGYGEAALPPYLKETQESVINFFKKININDLKNSDGLQAKINYIDILEGGNYAAKAALEMALHDLYGKQLNKPLHKLWNLSKRKLPPALFTIGITNNNKELEEKLETSKDFEILKLKVGNTSPLEQIKKLRKLTGKKICLDVNQGWYDKNLALEWIKAMADEGVIFVEQPFSKENLSEMAWLSEKSPLPVVADESFQNVEDLNKIKNCCKGINVKLMKCGGLDKARLIIEKAKQKNLMVVMGCMSESSCGVAAAAQLTPLVDYADLDGPLLINNDPFQGVVYEMGKILLPFNPGTGAKKIYKQNN